jgi:16S rRNA (cytidine1402-2'-O)-methyltransferase
MSGILYLVATPIGNLEDITLRAVRTLKESDVIACEDTRHSELLFRHLGFHKPLVRYNEHTHGFASEKILRYLEEGKKVCLVTDAGTPAISDPGVRLVRIVVEKGFTVIPIPGPSALTAALSASGVAQDGFTFLGFLPRRPGRARRELQEALGSGKTTVLFESPFRVKKTLKLVGELCPQAWIVVGRELTKIHEEFIRGNLETVQKQLETRPEKGEFVLMIEPVPAEKNEIENAEMPQN